MKKFRKDQKRNFFAGICNRCGEVYEASSAVDDLEGLTFDCKKVVCEGRVTMELGRFKNITEAQNIPLEDDGGLNSPPRRFC